MTTTMPAVDARGLYSKAQAAAALGVSTATVRRWCRKGILKTTVRRADMREVIPGKQIVGVWNMSIFNRSII